MAVTRNFLKGMGLTEEQVSAIIEEHVTTTNALKAQRDENKDAAEQLKETQKKLSELEAKGDGGWQEKYEKEHSDFEAYKTAQKNAETLKAKNTAFKEMLKDIGVSEKLMELVVKASGDDVQKLELEDGKIKDIDTVKATMKETYKDYITTEEKGGADTTTPPKNDGANEFAQMNLSDKMKFANEHPDAPEVQNWLKS